jgi:hypothetical protein
MKNFFVKINKFLNDSLNKNGAVQKNYIFSDDDPEFFRKIKIPNYVQQQIFQ